MSRLIIFMLFSPIMFGAMVVFVAMFFQRFIEAIKESFEDS